MRLNAPKKIVWLLSLVLAVISLVGFFVTIPVITVYGFWIMGVAWLLLFLSTYLKGM
ncbi:MAG: hypothetical protein ABFR75_08000 [Acidobacteriota bacterium]